MKPLSQRPWLAGRKPDLARRAQAVELYTAGLSTVEIAQRMGSFPGIVARMLEAARVQLRSRSESIELGKRRAARRRLIAEAAQRRFGHIVMAPRSAAPVKPQPVNAGFDDVEVLDIEWDRWLT